MTDLWRELYVRHLFFITNYLNFNLKLQLSRNEHCQQRPFFIAVSKHYEESLQRIYTICPKLKSFGHIHIHIMSEQKYLKFQPIRNRKCPSRPCFTPGHSAKQKLEMHTSGTMFLRIMTKQRFFFCRGLYKHSCNVQFQLAHSFFFCFFFFQFSEQKIQKASPNRNQVLPMARAMFLRIMAKYGIFVEGYTFSFFL